MSIATEIERLVGIKAAIKAAIIAKGQSVSDTDAFVAYADKISAIEVGSKITVTDDGLGNVTLNGVTVIEDATGNITLE